MNGRAHKTRPFARLAGLLVFLIALALVIGLQAHWRGLVQWLPAMDRLRNNTALCVVSCGAGLLALGAGLAVGWRLTTRWLAGSDSFLEEQSRSRTGELDQKNAALQEEISRRTDAEERLRQTTERLGRLAAIVKSSDDAIIATTLEGIITSWNPAATRLLGYDAEEIIGQQVARLIPPDRVEEERQTMNRIQRGQRVASFEAPRQCKDGRLIEMAITISPIEDAQGRVVGASTIARDITERKRAAGRMADSLREKDALLREVHHRVKNNMQVVSSLLQLQSNYLEDPKLLEPFQDCQSRIRTMALIHEKLYRSEGLAQIDFKEYLESLTVMLLRAHAKGANIRPEFHLEPVVLSIDTALPLGLIANELISNSLKHAFAGRQNGLVRIALSRHNAGEFRLAVGDDGTGLPDDISQSNSLGVRLVRILTGQIKGRMEYKNDHGAEFTITFSEHDSNAK